MGGKKAKRRSSSSSSSRPSSRPNESASSILGEIRSLSDTITTQGTNLSNQVTSVSNKLDSLDERIAGVEKNVSECQSTLDRHEKDIQYLLQHIKDVESSKSGLEERASKLESRMAIAESMEIKSPDSNFDRAQNPTVVKASAKVHVAKDALLASFTTLVEKVSLPTDCFKINGDQVGQHFTIQFSGSPNLASDRARLVLQSLRRGDGSWDRFLVRNPEGDLVQVFLGPDKSPKQVRTEILTKKLASIFQSKGYSEVHANRRQGQVCISWRPLVMVDVTSREQVELLWDSEYSEQLKVDRAGVCKLFKDAPSSAASPIKWEKLSSS